MKIHTYPVFWDLHVGVVNRLLASVGCNVFALGSDDFQRVCAEMAEDYPEYDVILIQYFDESYIASVRSALVRNADGGYSPVVVD